MSKEVLNPFQRKDINNQEEFKDSLRKYGKGFEFETFEEFDRIIRSKRFQINFLKPKIPRVRTAVPNKREVLNKLKDIYSTKYPDLKVENILLAHENGFSKSNLGDTTIIQNRIEFLNNSNKTNEFQDKSLINGQTPIRESRSRIVYSADGGKRHNLLFKQNKNDVESTSKLQKISTSEKGKNNALDNIKDTNSKQNNNQTSGQISSQKIQKSSYNIEQRPLSENHKVRAYKKEGIIPKPHIDRGDKDIIKGNLSDTINNNNNESKTPSNGETPKLYQDLKIRDIKDSSFLRQGTQNSINDSVFNFDENRLAYQRNLQMEDSKSKKSGIEVRFHELYNLFKNPDMRRNKSKSLNKSEISSNKKKIANTVISELHGENVQIQKSSPKIPQVKRSHTLRTHYEKKRKDEGLALTGLKKEFERKVKNEANTRIDFNPKKFDVEIEKFYEKLNRTYDYLERRVYKTNSRTYDMEDYLKTMYGQEVTIKDHVLMQIKMKDQKKLDQELRELIKSVIHEEGAIVL